MQLMIYKTIFILLYVYDCVSSFLFEVYVKFPELRKAHEFFSVSCKVAKYKSWML